MASEGGLGRASVLMASGSIVSRVLGIVRNAMLVACIGAAAPASVAFSTANVLPNIIFQLLSGGLLTSILIPQITKAMRRGDDGKPAIDALLTVSLGAVFVVTVISTLAAAPLITLFQLTDHVRTLGIMFAYLCLPQIFFYGAYAILGQVLNARDRFGEYMWTPVLANVVQICGMAIFLHEYSQVTSAERWTGPMIWLLAGTSTLGIVVQAAGLIPPLIRSGFSWRPNAHIRGHGFASAGRVAAWTVVAVIIAQAGGIVTQQAINAAWDQAHQMGRLVASLTMYLQAFTIFMVPFGVISVSILTALYPRMARAVQSGDDDGLLGLTLQGIRLPSVLLIPITFAAVALAVPGVAFLNPAMQPWEVRQTAIAFAVMAVGLAPYSVAQLQQRFSMAREDGRTNFRFQLVISGVQLLFAALIITVIPSHVAVIAVACGQTLGNLIAAALFLRLVRRDLGGGWGHDLGGLAWRMCAFSVAPTVVAWLAVHLVGAALKPGWFSAICQLGAGGILFVVVFVLLTRFSQVSELNEFRARIISRFAHDDKGKED